MELDLKKSCHCQVYKPLLLHSLGKVSELVYSRDASVRAGHSLTLAAPKCT